MFGTNLLQPFEQVAEEGYGACCTAIVCIPGLKDGGGFQLEFRFEKVNNGEKCYSEEVHGKWVTLCYSNFAEHGVSFARRVMDGEEGIVAVAVEGETGSLRPFMADCPKH